MAKKVHAASFLTPRARLSFPYLFEPNRSDGKERYMADLIFDATDKEVAEVLKAMRKECQRIGAEAFPGRQDVKLPFRRGSEKRNKDDGSVKSGYEGEGAVFISPWSKYRPGVVGTEVVEGGRLRPLSKEDVYGGCIVRAHVTPFVWESTGKVGVSFQLNHIQKLDDGERFGGGFTSAESAFGTEAAVAADTPFDDDDTLGF